MADRTAYQCDCGGWFRASDSTCPACGMNLHGIWKQIRGWLWMLTRGLMVSATVLLLLWFWAFVLVAVFA